MDDRSRLDPTFFSVPDTRWAEIGQEVYRELARVHVAIGLALTELEPLAPGHDASTDPSISTPTASLGPADLALQMHEVASHVLSLCAADERDLRQVISTLRTGLAVCWDLYSVRESERVTVAEHMNNLRTRIEDFERELLAVQRLKGKPEDSPTDD